MSPLLYLAAPGLLFLLGFCRPGLGIPLAILLALALWLSARPAASTTVVEPTRRPVQAAASVAALLMAWITGFAGGPFASDWIKHWALMNELAAHPWPVVIDLHGQLQSLRFYVGAYLVPAGLAKLAGSAVLPWAAVWFTLGYFLVFVGVARRHPLAPFLLLALGGADAFGAMLFRALGGWPPVPWLGIHVNFWAEAYFGLPLEFSSFVTALAWVPHQSIAVYLATQLLLDRAPAPRIALAMGLLALWSPYGLLGLLPVAALEAWTRRDAWSDKRLVPCLLAALAFGALVASWLATDLPPGGSCISCVFTRKVPLAGYASFLAFALAPFVLLLGRELWQQPRLRVAVLTLVALPFVHGQTPDLVMRASLGPLFILGLAAVERLVAWRAGTRVAAALALMLALPGVASEVGYLREGAQAHRQLLDLDPMSPLWVRQSSTNPQVTAAEYFDLCGWYYEPQYFTSTQPWMLTPRVSPPPQR